MLGQCYFHPENYFTAQLCIPVALQGIYDNRILGKHVLMKFVRIKLIKYFLIYLYYIDVT